MPLFMNPFKKYDASDFPGVLIPLSEAHRYHFQTAAEKKDDKEHDKADPTGSPSRSGYSPYTIEGIRAEILEDVAASGHDLAYDRKSKVINKAIQDIGMGPYNWQLFILCGFGWLADNLWLQGVALTLPQLTAEFGVDENKVRYTTCALFIGLCLGASVWGVASDVIGRRLAFNMTLFLAGVFGLAVGGAPNWIGVCGMFAALGFGVGGNLPVDGALFLEFLPFASNNLLTLLSIWWPVGQLIASLVAWGFIPNFPDDKGWRYFTITLGAMTFTMFSCRFFLFHLFESPKYLLSQGRQSESVAAVHGIAAKNKTKTWLTEEILNEIGGDPEIVTHQKLSTVEIVQRQLSKFSTERIAPLFSTRRLAVSTALIWFCWFAIGMAYPLFNAFLPQFLSQAAPGAPEPTTYRVYRDYVITSVVGVPGSIIACWTVNIKYIGRKGTMASATLLTGVFVFLFTVSANADFQVAFSSLVAFFQNIMYGVLYAYTPEVFPAPNRGTGTGIGSFLNRVAGFCAPIIAANSSANPKTPIYVSGGLFLASFIAMLALPIETRGKQSL
ncbi:MAG: hypothetical protein M1837_001515 [Sclerophora amabilis]|nr:MAG: hypothetical protein M1837_001515 [Sclerophora amabilis]